MRKLDWKQVELAGAPIKQRTPNGVRLARLSDAAREKIDDPMLTITTAMASGIRLCLQSDTTALEVETALTGLQYEGGVRRTIRFDLHIDGQPFDSREILGGGTYQVDFSTFPPTTEIRPGAAERISFRNLPEGDKRLDLWLPHNAEVELDSVWVEMQAELYPLVQSPTNWLHHGSSISHGKEVAYPSEVWPALVARDLSLNLTALGFSGQCMLDGCVAREIARSDADVISLKLGANVVAADTMRGRTFRSAVHNFLDQIRDAKPTAPVLVISPIFAPAIEQHPGPLERTANGFSIIEREDALSLDSLTMCRVREILSECIELRRRQGDLALCYLDGRQLLGPDDALCLVDGLHPDASGHHRIAQRFKKSLKSLIPTACD